MEKRALSGNGTGSPGQPSGRKMNLVPISPAAETPSPTPSGTGANPKKGSITFPSQTKGRRRVKSGPLPPAQPGPSVWAVRRPQAFLGGRPLPYSPPPPAEAAARAHLVPEDGGCSMGRPPPGKDPARTGPHLSAELCPRVGKLPPG